MYYVFRCWWLDVSGVPVKLRQEKGTPVWNACRHTIEYRSEAHICSTCFSRIQRADLVAIVSTCSLAAMCFQKLCRTCRSNTEDFFASGCPLHCVVAGQRCDQHCLAPAIWLHVHTEVWTPESLKLRRGLRLLHELVEFAHARVPGPLRLRLLQCDI